MSRILQIILLTATGYFLAGWLGQFFAIPPGYSTVIWPASGLAIAACLVFGYWSVVGVFIGSAVVNGLISFENTSQITLLIPVLIALGSSFQTLFSYFLVRRAIGTRLEFSNVRHVLSFIALAGPVGCLISATVGTLVLYTHEVIGHEQILLNWLGWWLGDSVGVIVLVPWLAVLFRKQFAVLYDHPFRVLLALFIVLLATAVLMYSTANFEINKQKQSFNASADLSATLLSERIKNSVDILYSLSGYVRGSSGISSQEFQEFSESVMSQDRAIKALSINHVLDPMRLSSYEESMSSLHGLPFKVKERNDQGHLQKVSPRDRYVSVGLIYPLETNIKALGFDVYSERTRREAIQNAIRLNSAFPTPAITLVQGSKAVLIFLPIYKQGVLYAMATGLFEIGDLSTRILDRVTIPGVEVYLMDRPADSSSYILAAGQNATLATEELSESISNDLFPVIHRSMIPVGAHQWELIHIARSQFIEQPWGTHFVLVGGLLVAGLLGWVLSLVFSHAAQIERQVEERTLELSNANLALRESGEKLKQATLAAQESNQAKSQFLANMSHEIRTPLNGMLGGLSLLKEQTLSAEQFRLVELAQQSGESLLDLVNDILDLSKIEAGELELENQYFDLQDLLEDTASLMRVKAEEKSLTFVAPETLLPERLVYADRLRIRQVMLNLLGNAIKFTPLNGRVCLRAEEVLVEADQATYRISIQDTGIGISESLQQRLFQRFKQADASTTRRYGGSGLGLAISKELMEAMNGKIDVVSQVGQGSTFWFEVKVPIKHKTDEVSCKVESVYHKAYLLSHVESDLSYLKAVLNQKRIQTYFISTLEDLPIIDSGTLFVVDDQMLGDEVVEKLREYYKQTIILLSQGHSLDLFKEFSIPTIYKPIHRRALYAVMEGMLHNQPILAEHTMRNPSDAIGAGAHVLLVEDNLTNQIVAKGMLALLGFKVDVAEDGAQAVTACQNCTYDLIFMDCQMPVMDGYEATRNIRQLNDVSMTPRDVPIIALSANAMKGDDQICYEAGMDDHVAKPISKERLTDVVMKWLGNKHHG